MKLRYSYIAVIMGALTFASCSDDFLSVKPKGTALEDNYYLNREEAYNGLVAVYDVLGFSQGLVTKVGALNSASDDHYAGGGGPTDMNDFQVWSNYTLDPSVGPQGALWKRGYSGVFRANVLLSKLPNVPMDETEKARFTAEAKLLRASFYFDLVRLFENIPLIVEPIPADEMYNIEQVAPSLVYAQIEKDLTEAIPDLPAQVDGEEAARVTSGTAHALLGKVYLYQEKWGDAADELAIVNGTPGEVNATYGYDLLDNFGDLFRTDNEFNSESIFEVSYTNTSIGVWDCGDCADGNILAVMSGPRSFALTTAGQGVIPEYVSGWSFFTITTHPAGLQPAMAGDPRYPFTIADMQQWEDDGLVTYAPGHDDTGYFLEKFAAKMSDRWTGAGNWELNFPHNIYEIRLADTYLMEAEALVKGNGDAGRAQDLLDAVRERVGLTSVPATIDNILAERRLELAGEGHRWFDLVRTGRAAQALAFKGFQAGKHEVLPIPLAELNNTKLEQNQEYGGSL